MEQLLKKLGINKTDVIASVKTKGGGKPLRGLVRAFTKRKK